MVDITALQNAVSSAEKYLIDVANNLPCGGTCSGWTGAATVNAQFAAQRTKDTAQGTAALESARLALQNGLNQLKAESEAAALIPQKVISNNSILGPDLVTQNTVTQPISGQTNKIPILPIVAAIGAGLLIYTVVRKKRK